MTQVFISYKSEYRDFANRLRNQLHAWDFETWMDVHDIPRGAYWPDEIDKGLRDSDVIIGLMAPEALTSRNVKNEWDWALDNSKPLIPLLIKPTTDMPHRYGSINYIDFTKAESDGFIQLEDALEAPVTRYQDGSTTPPPPPASAAEADNGTGPTWKQTLFIASLILAALTGLWFMTERSFEPFIAFLGSAVALVGSSQARDTRIKIKRTEHPIPEKTQQTNREVMLQKVHDYWIVGVLEKAEHNPLIDLTLAAPDKVLRNPDYGDYDLPYDANILTIFDDLQRELLILGAPGAGKTTLMLQLARELIKEAQADEKKSIPVVFNLSSWAAKREPLADWLKDRLWQEYQVPKKVAARWVDNGEILPLLDGLDEVAEVHRNDCVEAINTFRRSHSFVDLVVCSRIEEYTALTDRLQLASIQLQPLSPEQIDAYVQSDDLAGLRELIEGDAVVLEMAETPFLLNTLVYSYGGLSHKRLELHDTASLLQKIAHAYPQMSNKEIYYWANFVSRRDHLLGKYVQKQLKDDEYTLKQARDYLSWLAKGLVWTETSMFFIEKLQSTWFSSRKQYFLYILGLFTIALPYIVLDRHLHNIDSPFKSWTNYLWFTAWIVIIKWKIEPIEQLRLSWGGIRFYLIVIGACSLLLSIVMQNIFEAIRLGLVLAQIYIFVELFSMGSIFVPSQIEVRTRPNEGIFRSLRYGTIFGIGAFFASFFIIIIMLRSYSLPALSLSILIASFVSSIIFFIFGGAAAVKHATLRLLFCQLNFIPWNYAKFLDYCAEIGLLRKVGGGYIFVHRYLLEYFAGLEE